MTFMDIIVLVKNVKNCNSSFFISLIGEEIIINKKI